MLLLKKHPFSFSSLNQSNKFAHLLTIDLQASVGSFPARYIFVSNRTHVLNGIVFLLFLFYKNKQGRSVTIVSWDCGNHARTIDNLIKGVPE